MNNFIKFIMLVAVVLSAGCANSTKLISTTSDYEKFSPQVVEIKSNTEIINADDPVVNINIESREKYFKKYKKKYETKRGDLKNKDLLYGLGLMGIGGALISLGGTYDEKDSSLGGSIKVIGFVGGLYGLFLAIKATPIENYTRDSVDLSDTRFSDFTSCNSCNIKIYKDDELQKVVNTSFQGTLSLDVRSFLDKKSSLADLQLGLRYAESNTTLITLPSSYLAKIESNETQAAKLLEQAEIKLQKKQFDDAEKLTTELKDKFPLTYSAQYAAKTLADINAARVEQKISNFHKNLEKVTENKLANAASKVGLTADEAQSIGSRVESVSSNKISQVYKEVFSPNFDRTNAITNYKSLPYFKKLFLLLFYAEIVSNRTGNSKTNLISEVLYVSLETAQKLSRIPSSSLY